MSNLTTVFLLKWSNLVLSIRLNVLCVPVLQDHAKEVGGVSGIKCLRFNSGVTLKLLVTQNITMIVWVSHDVRAYNHNMIK